jgi:hypothetical protein
MGIYYWIDNLYMNQLTGKDLSNEGPIRRNIKFYEGVNNNEIIQKTIWGEDSPFNENPYLIFQFMKEDGCETLEEYA